MTYLDSNVFVIAANPDDERRKNALKLIQKIEDKNLEAITSVITVDEVVYTVAGIAGDEKAKETWEDLHSEPNLQLKELDEETVSSARKHFPEHDPRDALHLQTFKQSTAGKMVTEDKDFLENQEKAVSIKRFIE